MSTRRTSAYSFRWHRLLCSYLIVFAVIYFFSGLTLLVSDLVDWQAAALDALWVDPRYALHVLVGCHVAMTFFVGCWALLVCRQLTRFDPQGVERLYALPFFGFLNEWLFQAGSDFLAGADLWSLSFPVTTLRMLRWMLTLWPAIASMRCHYWERRLFLRGRLMDSLRPLPIAHRLLVGAGMSLSMALALDRACSLFLDLEFFNQPIPRLLLPQMPAVLPVLVAVCVACAAGDAVGFARLYHLRRRAFWLLVPSLLLPLMMSATPLLMMLTRTGRTPAALCAEVFDALGNHLLLSFGILAVLAGYYGLLRRKWLK